MHQVVKSVARQLVVKVTQPEGVDLGDQFGLPGDVKMHSNLVNRFLDNDERRIKPMIG